VGDEVGLDPSGLTQELGEAAEELVVGDGLERAHVFHEWEYRPCFFEALGARLTVSITSMTFVRSSRRRGVPV
jgi:hypothetical protein